MNFGTPPGRLFAALAMLGLAGCAATRYEPPPDVAPQPPEITTTEAIENARDAELAAALESAEAVEAAQEAVAAVKEETAPAEAVQPQVVPVSTSAATPASIASMRYRPTERSVEEIRTQSDATPVPLDFSERLDHAHDRAYAWTQGVVEATDHRFADKNGEMKPVPAAPFRIGLSLESFDRSDGVEMNIDANMDMALSLPNIESRLRLFVTSEDLDESPRVGNEDTDLRAGLRYELPRKLNFDLGVRLDWPPVAFASIKWQREYELGKWDFYPFAKLFVETDEGLGTSMAATFDRWHGRHLFRSSSYGRWTDQQNIVSWSQTFIYARAHQLIVPDRYGSYLRANDIGRGWGVRVLAAKERDRDRDNDVYVSNIYYEASFFYRRPTGNRWLYWFVEPLVRLDEKYDYNVDPGLRIGIDALFWDLARPAR